MRTRIDHATIITCEGNGVIPQVWHDASLTYSAGMVIYVGPTPGLDASGTGKSSPAPRLDELKGRPLGRILLAVGRVTAEQVDQALQLQQRRHGIIGQTLIHLGYINEAEVDWALAVQAGREPGALPAPVELRVVDGRGWLIVPGLVNTHHHLFQSLTRGYLPVQDAPLFEWLTGLYPVWQRVDFAAVHQAALISLSELLLSGCTLTSDHAYLFPPTSDVRLEAVLEAAELLGMRIHAGRGAMCLGQSAGGLPPDMCVESQDRVLADCERVIRAFHDPEPMSMRRIELAPCAPFNVSPELFDQMRALARQHGLLLHTHIGETLEEERFCLERYGVRPMEYLRQHEWLGRDVYLAHCVHMNDAEIRLLAETGTGVSHCPCSNMRLGSGAAPIRAMLDAGVRIGLGVDGSSSNDAGHLLAEAQQALRVQRLVHGASAMSAGEAFRLATVGGADVLHRPELGRLQPGSAADFAVYDAADVAFAGAMVHDPLAALMLGYPLRALRVVVAGRTVVDQGQVAGVDLPRVVSGFNQMVRDRFSL